MFLTILSAIAFSVGAAMTVHDLSVERQLTIEAPQGVVEVAPVQSETLPPTLPGKASIDR